MWESLCESGWSLFRNEERRVIGMAVYETLLLMIAFGTLIATIMDKKK